MFLRLIALNKHSDVFSFDFYFKRIYSRFNKYQLFYKKRVMNGNFVEFDQV